MNNSVLTTIAITGFGIAFFHAAIPTHWLPFVLTARAQRWSKLKTIVITAFAATGHATFTATLGLLVALLGVALSDRNEVTGERLAGGPIWRNLAQVRHGAPSPASAISHRGPITGKTFVRLSCAAMTRWSQGLGRATRRLLPLPAPNS